VPDGWTCFGCHSSQKTNVTTCTACGTARLRGKGFSLVNPLASSSVSPPAWRCGACETVNPKESPFCFACGADSTGGTDVTDIGGIPGVITIVTRTDAERGSLAQPPCGSDHRVATPPDSNPDDDTFQRAMRGRNVGIAAIVGALVPTIGVLLAIGLGVVAIVLGAKGLSGSPNPSPGRTAAIVGLALGIAAIIFKLIPGTANI